MPLLLRLVPVEDAWARIEAPVALASFGPGNRHDFNWYFEGVSSVPIETLDELQDWLLGCSYCRDPDLFHEPDFWQHPATFEALRKGDCEDYALWAWRKLVELGYDADLVAGHLLPLADGKSGHVWVVFRRDGVEYLLDGVNRSKERMVRPLAEVRDRYRPQLGVDRNRERFAYGGFLVTMRERQAQQGKRRTA